MKSIVLYYSYTGNTKKVAEKLAKTQGADLVEIKTVKRKGRFLTYLVDCPRAMRHKSVPIQPLAVNLSDYEMITMASPIWASNPAPAFNAAVKLLPKGKHIQVVMVSASGSSKKCEPEIRKMIHHQGCSMVGYKNVKQPV